MANGQMLLTVFPQPTNKTLNGVQGVARGERMSTAIARQRKIVAKGGRDKRETLPAIGAMHMTCPMVNATSKSSAWLLGQLAQSLVDELA